MIGDERSLSDLVAERAASAEVMCDAGFHRCRCALPAGHEELAHACRPVCGGSWEPDPEASGGVRILSYPSGRVASTDEREDVGNPYGEGEPEDDLSLLNDEQRALAADLLAPRRVVLPRAISYYPWHSSDPLDLPPGIGSVPQPSTPKDTPT